MLLNTIFVSGRENRQLGYTLIFRGFHATRANSQMPNHPLFKRVDWDRVKAGSYAIINPLDGQDILYLSSKEFKAMVRIALSNDQDIQILATAGSEPISPLYKGFLGLGSASGRKIVSSLVGSAHHSLNSFVRLGEGGTPEVLPGEGNLTGLLGAWYTYTMFLGCGRVLRSNGSESNHLKHFQKRLLTCYRNEGVPGTVKRLKALLFLLHASAGKMEGLHSYFTGVGIKLNNAGVPLDFHPQVRHAIAKGDSVTIRIWASVLSIYKVIPFEGKADISSITDSPKAFDPKLISDLEQFAPLFWECKTRASERQRRLQYRTEPVYLNSASPNAKLACQGYEIDAFVWDALYGIKESPLWEFLTSVGSTETYGRLLQSVRIAKHLIRECDLGVNTDKEHHSVELWSQSGKSKIPPTWRKSQFYSKGPFSGTQEYTLSKLTALIEPAGKVRVVAMVDSWTQECLQPLHSWMEKILMRISEDATFDQNGRLLRYLKKGIKENFCYDLKSATDKLPRLIYSLLFSASPMGPRTTKAWLNLLVDRPFHLSQGFIDLVEGEDSESQRVVLQRLHHQRVDPVRYGTGQPMGALSSWPSMALVHHFIVQFCAHTLQRANARGRIEKHIWFKDYVILGDDIVIGNPEVARNYKDLMKNIQVAIGLGKSFVTTSGLVNFANQTYIGLEPLSGISLREVCGIDSLAGALEFGRKAILRKFFACPRKLDKPTGNLIHEWSVPTLVKTLVDPSLWVGYISKALAEGFVPTPVRLALMLWFYPSDNCPLGVQNPTFAPVARILHSGPEVMCQKSQLLGGRYPSSLVIDGKSTDDKDLILKNFFIKLLSGLLDKVNELIPKSSLETYSDLSKYLSGIPEILRTSESLHWTGYLDSVMNGHLLLQAELLRVIDILKTDKRGMLKMRDGEPSEFIFKDEDGRIIEEAMIEFLELSQELFLPIPDFQNPNFGQILKKLLDDPLKGATEFLGHLLDVLTQMGFEVEGFREEQEIERELAIQAMRTSLKAPRENLTSSYGRPGGYLIPTLSYGIPIPLTEDLFWRVRFARSDEAVFRSVKKHFRDRSC